MDDQDDRNQEVFTVPQFRQTLGRMSKAVFYSEVAAGRLMTFRVGRRPYVSRQALEAYVRAGSRRSRRAVGSGELVSAPVPHGNDAVVIPAAALSVATDQPDVGGDGGGDPPGRPALIVTDVNHADLTNERTRILAAANEPPYLFVVGDTLARVNIGEAGLPQIELVPPPALRYRVAAVVDTVSVTRNGVKKIIPPLALMQAVLSLHDAPFPLLAGITGSPFVQSDHQLVADGGYDHTSGLLYVPAPGFSLPRMSTCPTREESHRACQHRPNLDPFAPAES